MQMSFISQVGHVVVTLSIFKTGHLNPTPIVSMTDTKWGYADIWMLYNYNHTHTHLHRHKQLHKIKGICWILFAYSNSQCTWNTDTHTYTPPHTQIAWQWPWYMYICKPGQPILCRPGPNHSNTLSRETTSQPLSPATKVTEENIWPQFIHPSLHPSLPSFICYLPWIPLLLHIKKQRHACIQAIILWDYRVAVKNS